MNTWLRLTASAGAGVAAVALLAAPASAAPAHRPWAGPPVFVQTDNPAGNAIVSYTRTGAGTLVQVGSQPTGGKGGVLTGSVVDHLASQGSLTYDRGAGLLYAVNAGSNTITTFTVDGARLTRRQVISSGGTFPVSITTTGNQVYVLNARHGGSVQGYLRIGRQLVLIPSWHRSLDLKTAPATSTDEFTSTPGQIGVTPDGRQLLVSTKNGGNSVEAYRLSVFGPAPRPVVTALPGTVPFGFAFDQRGTLVLTEAGPNAVATFRVGPDGRLTALSSTATGQAATCWVVTSGGVAYASNAGSGTLSRYAVGSRGRLTGLGLTATSGGTVDAAVSRDGSYLYVQTGLAGAVDAFRINHGALTAIGSVTVPGAVGGEGIVAL